MQILQQVKALSLFTLYDCPGVNGESWENAGCSRLLAKADAIFLMIDSVDIPLSTSSELQRFLEQKAPKVPIIKVFTKDDQLKSRSRNQGNILSVSAVAPIPIKNDNVFLEATRAILGDPNIN